MKSQTGQWRIHHPSVENLLVTDSAVLSERDVASALNCFPETKPRLPRVVYGIRNGLILSGVFWVAILALFFVL
jgi:hypothetical protein